MKLRFVIPLLLAAAFAAAPATAGAEWIGPNPTRATIACTPTLIEGQTYSEECPITVTDESGAVDAARVPLPPTGTVTVNGTTECTLVPSGEATSVCEYTTTATWGTTFTLEFVYSGDEVHQGTLSYYVEWAPGYPNYPPEIQPTAPPPPPPGTPLPPGTISLPSGPSDLRIVTWPAEVTREHLATFRFAGGAHYEYALDKGRFLPSGASFSRRVSTGTHALRLRTKRGGPAVLYRWRVLPQRR